MESEDEEVIFENSVLHQALTDIGVTDLKTEPRLYLQDHFENGPNSLKETNSLPNDSKARRLYDLNSSFITRIFYSPKLLEEVHHYHRYHILKSLITSHLLSEDDQVFLQSYIDEEAPTRNPATCLSLCTFNFICILIASLILVGVVCPVDMLSSWVVLLIDSMPQVFSGLLHLYYRALSAILLILAWILCFLVPLLLLKRNIYHRIMSQMQKQDKHIQELVVQAEELLRLEKKSLRLIKESELVSRGFTVANQHNVASRGSQGLTSSPYHQLCPGLRQIMFSENIKVMREVKKWVVKMLKGIPMICMDSDFSSLEALKLHEGQSVKEDDTHTHSEITRGTREDLNRFTTIGTAVQDESGMEVAHEDLIISPSELSRSVELLNVYFSGFIRRLAMCFYPQNLKDATINPYMATLECTEMSKRAIERARSLLKQSYTFYRSVHHYDGNGATKKMPEPKHEQSQIYKLYVCVNSLDLHLQSLLQITRNLTVTLEDQVDKEQDSMGSVDITKPGEDDRKLWEDVLKRIKSGLESCRGCYEESLKTLHQKLERDTITSPVKKPNPETAQPKQTVTWIAAEEPIIVDQVFEAINDRIEEEDVLVSRPKYTAEDRARHQADKEALTRFKQELHTVVGHRAIIHKAREEWALARTRGEDTLSQQTSQELPSDLVPGEDSKIMTHIEPTLGFSDKEEPADTTVDAEQMSSGTLLTQTEVESRTAHQMQLVLTSSCSQIEGKKYKDPRYGVERIPESFFEREDCSFRDRSSCEQFNRIVQKENSSLSEDGDLISTHHTREEESFGHKRNIDSILQSAPIQKQPNILENQLDTCIDSECRFINHVNVEIGGFGYGDIVGTHNGMMSQEKILHDSCNKNCSNHQNSSETGECMLPSGSNLNNSHGKCGVYLGNSYMNEEIEGNIPDTATLKDSKTESALLQLSPAGSSDCNDLSSLTLYNVSKQTSVLLSDSYNVNSSHENLITANEEKIDSLKQERMGLKFYDTSAPIFPSMSNSNFTKNIAMMAASQARNLTRNLGEEHFGDESSDSENSDSQIIGSDNDIVYPTDKL